MKIYILHETPTQEQVREMLESIKDYIKLAVDVERGIVAGGGAMHADCENVLLEDGSKQEDIWGADWSPNKREVSFESLINIRPRQNNRGMIIQDPELRNRIAKVVRAIFEG